MNFFIRRHEPLIALALLLLASLACGDPPTPVPTLDVQAAIAQTQTAGAAVLPTFTEIVISTPFPTDTLIPIPTATPTTIPTLVLLPTETLIVIATPTLSPAGGTCSCAGDTLNCTDFSSHSSAQACYDYCISAGAGDIHNLDSDGDGNSCESLP